MKNGFLVAMFALVSVPAMAQLNVSPWNVDFGRVEIGRYAPSRTIWVRNYGSEPTSVEVRDSLCYSEFRVRDNCYWELAPNESCSIDVSFDPNREGNSSCSIDVIDGDYNRETVRVSGQAYKRN